MTKRRTARRMEFKGASPMRRRPLSSTPSPNLTEEADQLEEPRAFPHRSCFSNLRQRIGARLRVHRRLPRPLAFDLPHVPKERRA